MPGADGSRLASEFFRRERNRLSRDPHPAKHGGAASSPQPSSTALLSLQTLRHRNDRLQLHHATRIAKKTTGTQSYRIRKGIGDPGPVALLQTMISLTKAIIMTGIMPMMMDHRIFRSTASA